MPFDATDIAPVLYCQHVLCAKTLVEVLVLIKSCVEEGTRTGLTRKMALGELARLYKDIQEHFSSISSRERKDKDLYGRKNGSVAAAEGGVRRP